jgi:hypothetical protein
MAENKDIWEGLQNRRLQDHDVVTLKQTVTLEDLKGKRVEIKAGWKGTIIAHADKPTPFVEFTNYSEEPILVDVEAVNFR